MIKKISIRWFLWFALVSGYALILGALLYFNLFKRVFDAELQDNIINVVRTNSNILIEGLVSRELITIPEVDLISSWPRQDHRISNIVYFNGNGTIRWHKDSDKIKMRLPEYHRSGFLDTDAVVIALRTGEYKVFLKNDGSAYDIAVPLRARDGKVAGVVSFEVSRDSVKENINGALKNYLVGSILIFILMGMVLYIFVIKNVTRPIVALTDSIDNISTKSFQLDFAERSDEVGELARAVQNFLGKVKKELEEREIVDKSRQHYEQEWWSSVLAITIPKGSRALVVDENNNVMHANFELAIKKDGPVHLLDIFGGTQQDIVHIVGQAMDNPGKIFRARTQSNGKAFGIKALQLSSKGGIVRTVIVLEPLSVVK